jgi:hypothetical protein
VWVIREIIIIPFSMRLLIDMISIKRSQLTSLFATPLIASLAVSILILVFRSMVNDVTTVVLVASTIAISVICYLIIINILNKALIQEFIMVFKMLIRKSNSG